MMMWLVDGHQHRWRNTTHAERSRGQLNDEMRARVSGSEAELCLMTMDLRRTNCLDHTD